MSFDTAPEADQSLLTTSSPTFAGLTLNGALDMTSHLIHNVTDPAAAQDVATRNYVDATATGLFQKTPARAKAVSAKAYIAAGSGAGKTLTAPANGLISAAGNVVHFDGVTLVLNDRVLIDQVTFGGANLSCGIYYVSSVGAAGAPYVLTRTTDADNSPAGEFRCGLAVSINEGAVWTSTNWVLSTPDPITIDVTAVAFTQTWAPTVAAPIIKTGATIGFDQTNVPALDYNGAMNIGATLATSTGFGRVATTSTFASKVHAADSTDSTGSSTAACIYTAGGISCLKKLYTGGALTVEDATASTSTTTGSAILSGGLGLAGAIWAGGLLNETGVRFFAGDFTPDGGGPKTVDTTVGAGWQPRALYVTIYYVNLNGRSITSSGFVDQANNQWSTCTDTDGVTARTDGTTTSAVHFREKGGGVICDGVISLTAFATGFRTVYGTNTAALNYHYFAVR